MEGSIAKIKEIISREGEYERRLEAVKEARRRVIEEYNLLAMINNIVESRAETVSIKTKKKIYNRRMMRLRYPPDLLRFMVWKAENFFKNIYASIFFRKRQQ
jgi:phosphotransacetylase